ncbi:MAG: CBS domain-containing protein [Phenylobacterium sp.]|jgi:CBS domain-containing protein
MGYWIYNMGLAVPVSSQRLLNKHKVLPLAQLAKNPDLRGADVEGQIESVTANVYRDTQKQQRYKVSRADQIMSSPVTVLKPQMTFAEVWAIFSQKRYRHFLVADDANQLMGVVSDRDLLSKVANEALNKQPRVTNKTVEQIMQTSVLTASANTAIQELCQVMFSQHIGALPITTDEGKVLGIVTRSDILRSMIMHGPLELYI